MKSILLVKKLLGLVEMTSGLVNASCSLPWASCKNDFLCTLVPLSLIRDVDQIILRLPLNLFTTATVGTRESVRCGRVMAVGDRL